MTLKSILVFDKLVEEIIGPNASSEGASPELCVGASPGPSAGGCDGAAPSDLEICQVTKNTSRFGSPRDTPILVVTPRDPTLLVIFIASHREAVNFYFLHVILC